jgi:Ca2+-binding RTX toxin-like protein
LSDNVENLVLKGAANLTGTGNSGANVFYDNNGTSTFMGLGGNDSYVVRNPLTQIIEGPGQGIDTIYASVDFALPDNVENLVLAGTSNLNGTGNGGANNFYSNIGDNILTGGGGDDVFIFGQNFGADTITDFDVTSDYIAFDATLFSGYLSVLAQTSDDAQGNAVIAYDSANSVTLLGINKAALEAHPGVFWF